MASLAISENFLAVCSRDRVIVTSSRGDICLKYQLDELPYDQSEEKEEDDSSRSIPRKEINHIVDCRFSPFEKYLAICSSDKVLYVWKTNDWKLVFTRNIPRRPMKFLFSENEDTVLVADKTGDVYKLAFQTETPEHILGHLAVILDMKLSSDYKELITCDRDGKIRISSYPNCYNIDKFLMAHMSFVSSIALDNKDEYVLAIDGNGQLFLWEKESGRHLDHIEIKKEENCIPRKICINTELEVFVIVDQLNRIVRYEVKEGKINKLDDIELDSLPLDLVCDEREILILQQSTDEPLICYQINDEQKCEKVADSKRLLGSREIQTFLQEPSRLEPWKCSGWADDQS